MAEAFLKWAGGKKWFVRSESDRLPSVGDFNKYIEPFLGGGSVFFYLEPQNALLSDYNEELIRTYIALRDNFKGVLKLLKLYEKNHSKDFYYEVRSMKPNNHIEAAARMIYLNKACFNGIYRVNRKGDFNVPYGSRDIITFDEEKLIAASIALQGVEILRQEYQISIDEAEEGDFVFCDPPYALKTGESFIGYNTNSFGWEDQILLAEALQRAAERGVKIMITNVDAPEVRQLYDEATFLVDSTVRKCNIAGGNEGRRIYTELVATANI